MFDLLGVCQGLTPPLDEDHLPSGGRKFWSGVGFSLTENVVQKMLHFPSARAAL